VSFFFSVYFQFSCKGFQEKKRFINVLAEDADPPGGLKIHFKAENTFFRG